jgi:alkanesulfonate monooxygenase SsuD/methylene tetrahydromethanopterin reductase-like flavin-dependent oxidoreductase (luciferase family)
VRRHRNDKNQAWHFLCESGFEKPRVCTNALTAIDVISSGRLFAGVAPGSHRGDYDAAGLPFEERWGMFFEAFDILARLWSGNDEPLAYSGRYYKLDGLTLKPRRSLEKNASSLIT